MGIAPASMSVGNTEVAETSEERQHFSELLKEQLVRAQNRMKVDANTRRSPRQFQVGELVLLKLQPYVQTSVVSRPCPKLVLKYFGSYKVLERIGQAAYKLDLPSNALVHLVFHVSQLKSFTLDHRPVFSQLPTVP
jgi:hypothetical protein